MPNASHNSLGSKPTTEGLSVIVPLLNERSTLAKFKVELDALGADQIILVDGGSDDGTVQWLQQNWCGDSVSLVQSAAGRATQMNAGAACAKFSMLLFLHADTRLPYDAKQEICGVETSNARQSTHWGRFDVRFDSSSRAMRVIAWFINLRSRLTHVATGDQAIFVHADLFARVGEYPAIALMEDVAITKKLRKIAPPYCSRSRVTTSARRWEKHGVVTTVVKMWWFRLAFALGISADRLAKSYSNSR